MTNILIDNILTKMRSESFGYENLEEGAVVIDQEVAEEVLEDISENIAALDAQAEVVEELQEDLEEIADIIDSGTTEGQVAAEHFMDKMALFYNTSGYSAKFGTRLSKESLSRGLSTSQEMMTALVQSQEGIGEGLKKAWHAFVEWLGRVGDAIANGFKRVVSKFSGAKQKDQSELVKINKERVANISSAMAKVGEAGDDLSELMKSGMKPGNLSKTNERIGRVNKVLADLKGASDKNAEHKMTGSFSEIRRGDAVKFLETSMKAGEKIVGKLKGIHEAAKRIEKDVAKDIDDAKPAEKKQYFNEQEKESAQKEKGKRNATGLERGGEYTLGDQGSIKRMATDMQQSARKLYTAAGSYMKMLESELGHLA